jgi:hypothetical protein
MKEDICRLTKSAMCLFLSNSALIHEIVSFRVSGSGMTEDGEVR